MQYLAFYTDHEYEEGSLGDHLRYLDVFGGTPDMWCGYDDLGEAIDAVRARPVPMVIVDERNSMRVIYTHDPETAT